MINPIMGEVSIRKTSDWLFPVVNGVEYDASTLLGWRKKIKGYLTNGPPYSILTKSSQEEQVTDEGIKVVIYMLLRVTFDGC